MSAAPGVCGVSGAINKEPAISGVVRNGGFPIHRPVTLSRVRRGEKRLSAHVKTIRQPTLAPRFSPPLFLFPFSFSRRRRVSDASLVMQIKRVPDFYMGSGSRTVLIKIRVRETSARKLGFRRTQTAWRMNVMTMCTVDSKF